MPGSRTPPEGGNIPKGLSFRPSLRWHWNRCGRRLYRKVPVGVVLADAAYGNRYAIPCRRQRTGIAIRGSYRVVHNHLGARAATLTGPAAKARSWCATKTDCSCNADHLPVSAKQLAGLPSPAWMVIGWRQGSKGTLRSRLPPCVCALPIAITSVRRHIPGGGVVPQARDKRMKPLLTVPLKIHCRRSRNGLNRKRAGEEKRKLSTAGKHRCEE